jgi:hypothetical protein
MTIQSDLARIRDYCDNARSEETQEAFERMESALLEMMKALSEVHHYMNDGQNSSAESVVKNFFTYHPDALIPDI